MQDEVRGGEGLSVSTVGDGSSWPAKDHRCVSCRVASGEQTVHLGEFRKYSTSAVLIVSSPSSGGVA